MDDDVQRVLDELRDREPLFHRPELGMDRTDFEAMTEADFWEIGASGRAYSRSFVIEELGRRYASGPYDDPWATDDFHCTRLCTDLYLVTYTLTQESRVTRRSTLWRRRDGTWRAVFHQGTEFVDSSR